MTTETVEVKMTWQDVVPMLVMVLTDGNATGQAAAKEELQRMAQVADMTAPAHEEIKALRTLLIDARAMLQVYLAGDVIETTRGQAQSTVRDITRHLQELQQDRQTLDELAEFAKNPGT